MLSRLEWELEQRKQYVACPILIPFSFFYSQHQILLTNALLYNFIYTFTHTLHRLAEQHGDLEKNIGEQQTDISKMEDNLSSLQPTLENIRKATLPLQESLGLPLDKRRTENEMAHLLPPWVVIKKIMWLGNFFFSSLGHCTSSSCKSGPMQMYKVYIRRQLPQLCVYNTILVIIII